MARVEYQKPEKSRSRGNKLIKMKQNFRNFPKKRNKGLCGNFTPITFQMARAFKYGTQFLKFCFLELNLEIMSKPVESCSGVQPKLTDVLGPLRNRATEHTVELVGIHSDLHPVVETCQHGTNWKRTREDGDETKLHHWNTNMK